MVIGSFDECNKSLGASRELTVCRIVVLIQVSGVKDSDAFHDDCS